MLIPAPCKKARNIANQRKYPLSIKMISLSSNLQSGAPNNQPPTVAGEINALPISSERRSGAPGHPALSLPLRHPLSLKDLGSPLELRSHARGRRSRLLTSEKTRHDPMIHQQNCTGTAHQSTIACGSSGKLACVETLLARPPRIAASISGRRPGRVRWDVVYHCFEQECRTSRRRRDVG